MNQIIVFIESQKCYLKNKIIIKTPGIITFQKFHY